jgi:cytochrome P450
VHEEDPAALSAEELLGNLTLLLFAGFETTTNLLGNGLRLLLDRPDHAARLRDDPGLVAAYVEEMLRYDSPVQLTSRWAAEEVELAGVTVPARSSVLLALGAANRDRRRFADPAVFDPDRPDNQPLSFGAGPHFCLGAALARQEAQVAFPLLLNRLPGLRLAGEPVRRDRMVLRGYQHLPLAAG